jgi:hypothetical protein
VPGGDEAVGSGDAVYPRVDLAVAHLDDPVAARADEVMMMVLAAPAVTDLVRAVAKLMDDAGRHQHSQRAVDGRESEALAAPSQPSMKTLGGDVVPLAHELGEDAHALGRGTKADALEEPFGRAPALLRLPRHLDIVPPRK